MITFLLHKSRGSGAANTRLSTMNINNEAPNIIRRSSDGRMFSVARWCVIHGKCPVMFTKERFGRNMKYKISCSNKFYGSI